jgi:anti-sigma factor ChrR (cupin superfamily)
MVDHVNIYDDFDWQDSTGNGYAEGTKQKVLRDENSAKTILLKLPKGFNMPSHSHVTTEQHFVLKGEYISEGKNYQAGSYQIIKAHENHGPFVSKEGALLIVIWDAFLPYRSDH